MKFEKVIKSVIIAGLLAGVTDVNAVSKRKVGVREGCHLLIVENTSHLNANKDPNTDYVLQATFISCNSDHNNWSYKAISPGEKVTLCVEPGTDVGMDQRWTKNLDDKRVTRIPATTDHIDQGWHYICGGTSTTASCRHNPVSQAEIDADGKLPIEQRCVSVE